MLKKQRPHIAAVRNASWTRHLIIFFSKHKSRDHIYIYTSSSHHVTIFFFRTKSEGRLGSAGLHVHVFLARRFTLAGTQGTPSIRQSFKKCRICPFLGFKRSRSRLKFNVQPFTGKQYWSHGGPVSFCLDSCVSCALNCYTPTVLKTCIICPKMGKLIL